MLQALTDIYHATIIHATSLNTIANYQTLTLRNNFHTTINWQPATFFPFFINKILLLLYSFVVFAFCSSLQFSLFRKLLLLFLQSFGVIALEFFEILHMLRIFFFQRFSRMKYNIMVGHVERPHHLIAKFTRDWYIVEWGKGSLFYLVTFQGVDAYVSVMLSVQTQSQLETQTNTRNSLRAQRAKIVIFRAKRGKKIVRFRVNPEKIYRF